MIGVVKDFHISGLQEAIEPLCIVLEESVEWYRPYSYLMVRISTNDVQGTLGRVQQRWESLAGD